MQIPALWWAGIINQKAERERDQRTMEQRKNLSLFVDLMEPTYSSTFKITRTIFQIMRRHYLFMYKFALLRTVTSTMIHLIRLDLTAVFLMHVSGIVFTVYSSLCVRDSMSVCWEGPLVKRICIPNWIWSSLWARRGDLAAQCVIIDADGQINWAPKLPALHTSRECPSGATALLHTPTDGCHKQTRQIRDR